MEYYYWQTKSPDVGLGSPEKTYLGDKFYNLEITYHIPKDNIYNTGMLNKEKIWNSVCIQ